MTGRHEVALGNTTSGAGQRSLIHDLTAGGFSFMLLAVWHEAAVTRALKLLWVVFKAQLVTHANGRKDI